MPRSLVGFLAAASAAMGLISGNAQGLLWLIVLIGCAAAGLAAIGAIPAPDLLRVSKKTLRRSHFVLLHVIVCI